MDISFFFQNNLGYGIVQWVLTYLERLDWLLQCMKFHFVEWIETDSLVAVASEENENSESDFHIVVVEVHLESCSSSDFENWSDSGNYSNSADIEVELNCWDVYIHRDWHFVGTDSSLTPF